VLRQGRLAAQEVSSVSLMYNMEGDCKRMDIY
jgi:hypothetical protein